jgi:hypothetical protein
MEHSELGSLDMLDGECRSGSRSWIAVYRPELSFHGQQLMQTLPKMRYFNVITMRARPDHEQDFVELGKLAGETLAQTETLLFAINPKMSYVSQQVIAGDPAEPEKTTKPTGERSR